MAHGGRSVLGCVGFTGPGRNARARGKAGEEVVQGNRGLGPSVLACRLREAFDAVGHVGHERRPLRPGDSAASGGESFTKFTLDFGHIWMLVAGLKHFSSMFIGGRPEILKSNFANLCVKVGGRSCRSSGRDSGVGGYGARRAVGVDTSTLAAAAGVEIVSFLTSSAACLPTRTTWPEAPQK